MIYSFGQCQLDTERLELRRDGELQAVEPQVFSLITLLIENRDHVVSKEDLIAAIWHGRIVSDASLSSRISAARTAVGDTGRSQAIIRTMPKRGFRFVADVLQDKASRAEPQSGAYDYEAMGKSLPDKPSIAVLPFDNMSGDPEQEYFSDGIAEDIITGLSHMKGIFVIARNSSFTYKGQAVDVTRVGRELGVRYILEGSVRRGGERVRVTAQLIDAGTGLHVWADRYDGTLEDVFALQDDITAKVLGAVGPEITLAEMQRARAKRSESFDAWDLYLQALQPYHALGKAGHKEAIALLRQAIELDPRFSTAYATLARCHTHAAFHGWGTSAREEISKAENFARQAVTLDPQDPIAHVALGRVHTFNTDPGRAVNILKQALELNPNLPSAYGYLSDALAFLGRPDEALATIERALRGSPRDPERFMWYLAIMNAHFVAERYEEAVEAGEQSVLLQPNFYGGHFIMASALPYLGRIEEAKESLSKALKLMPRLTLKNTARNPMFVREDDVARMLEGLRRAGLRE